MSVVTADAPDAWVWEVAAVQRTLVERDSAGQRLVKESGPLARFRVVAQPAWNGPGRIEFGASLTGGQLDYDGRTQGGAALATRSRHREVEAGVRWAPFASRPWGEVAVTFDGSWLRRSIAATSGASSLTETSMLWMPGLGWRSASWPLAHGAWGIDAQWRASVHHALAVDYAGVFDRSSIAGGHRSEATLGVRATLPSHWAVALKWTHARQSASATAPVYRSGVIAGTVQQPRMDIDDVAFVLSRRF